MEFKLKSNKINKQYAPDKYYIGDPCYVIPDNELWDEFCKTIHDTDVATVSADGVDFFVGRTAHGDGYYPVLGINYTPVAHFGVDAGLVCVMSEALVRKFNPREEFTFFSIEKGFTVKLTDVEGNYKVGEFTIKTNNNSAEEE